MNRIEHRNRALRYGYSLVLIFASLIGLSEAQAAQQSPVSQAPVQVNHKTLFTVPGALSFPAAARAEAISERIERLSKDIAFNPESMSTADSESATDIVADDLVVMSVTDQDAKAAGQPRQALARDYMLRIRAAVVAMRKEYSLRSMLLGVFYAAIATVILLLFFRILPAMFSKLYATLHRWQGVRIRSLKIQRFELLPAERITRVAVAVAKLVRFVISLLALYFYASVVLSFFPWTRGYAQVLVGYAVSPIKAIGDAIVSFVPNLFFIAVLTLLSIYLTKFVKVIFMELERGTITIPSFFPEWSEPTYKIVRFLIIVLTLVVIFPYFPGSHSPAFRGVSIFLGVLFSLGSTSAVANVVAGVILTYMRPFKIGDRVKIADTEGDIIERTLLVTRIRSIKNVEIAIANSMVLGSHIINFSASAEREGLILHTTVTIGYDAPWRTVHKLLTEAALATENVLAQPQPFIFQTALDDFYVHYELNAYTDQPSKMANIYSDLHQNIQDKFYEAGVEIMSPHYSSVRDGNSIAIPAEYRPRTYSAPTFRLGILNDVSSALPGRREGGE